MLAYMLTFILSILLCLYLTPMMIQAAVRHGIVDRPDNRLKRQKEPVPYLGGLSIYLSFLISLSMTFHFNQAAVGLLLSGTMIILLGLIDDLGILPPAVKLAGQCLAAFVLIKSGIKIELVFLPWYINLPLSFLWLVGITNAFNIIDIMDGLATGVAAICSLFLFYLAIINQQVLIAMVTVALAGALIGFLRYNFEPARIYLGDTGSMFTGFMIGALTMICKYTVKNNVGYLAPLVLLGLPIFDTFFVSYIRFRRGIPIFMGSRDHFALRLRKWRLTTRQTVLSSYLITLVLGTATVFIVRASNLQAVAIMLVLVALALFLGYLLKRVDMSL